VDIATIRWSDPSKGLRYIYMTPRVAQEALVHFDQGEVPEPFILKIAGAQVTRMPGIIRKAAIPGRGRGPSDQALRAAASDAKLSDKSSIENSRDQQRDPLGAKELRSGGRDSSVPRVVGGKPPPIGQLSRRRASRSEPIQGAFDLPQLILPMPYCLRPKGIAASSLPPLVILARPCSVIPGACASPSELNRTFWSRRHRWLPVIPAFDDPQMW
jgi:hypothetical protein